MAAEHITFQSSRVIPSRTFLKTIKTPLGLLPFPKFRTGIARKDWKSNDKGCILSARTSDEFPVYSDVGVVDTTLLD